MSIGMIVVECPDCGGRCYGYSQEEALQRYYKRHRCPRDMTVEQLHEILMKCINEGKKNVQDMGSSLE